MALSLCRFGKIGLNIQVVHRGIENGVKAVLAALSFAAPLAAGKRATLAWGTLAWGTLAWVMFHSGSLLLGWSIYPQQEYTTDQMPSNWRSASCWIQDSNHVRLVLLSERGQVFGIESSLLLPPNKGSHAASSNAASSAVAGNLVAEELFTSNRASNSIQESGWIDIQAAPMRSKHTSPTSEPKVPESTRESSTRESSTQELAQTVESRQLLVALGSMGRDVFLLNREPPKAVELPLYYPVRAIGLCYREKEGKQYLMGLSATGHTLSQMEVVGDWESLKVVRTIDLQSELYQGANALLCDEVGDLIYVLGRMGRLMCYSSDPKSDSHSLGVLQVEQIPAGEWELFQVVSDTAGCLGAFERHSRVAYLWKLHQKEGGFIRTLDLSTWNSPLLLRQLPLSPWVIGVDAMGKISCFKSGDFLIE